MSWSFVLFIALIISLFTNLLVRSNLWKNFLKGFQKEEKFSLGKLFYKWGSCLRCLTFWISSFVFGFYFLHTFHLKNIFFTFIATMFTTSLAMVIKRLANW